MPDSTHPPSLQERYAPQSICFGCGPANKAGLHIRSLPVSESSDEVVLHWTPAENHQAFEGILNGGIIGTLLDCHSNWAATWHLMRRDDLQEPPVTVTADFHVKLQRPTPSDRPLEVRARAVESNGSFVTVEATVSCDGQVTATCRGHFVAVKPGHPAHHSW